MVDIPAVTADEPVNVAPVAARTYDLQYPVLLVYRYVADVGGGQPRPIMQRLTMAPARIDAEGNLDVLLDPATLMNFDGVDIRHERERSPVFRYKLDEFVKVMALMAKELAFRQAIAHAKEADPKADVSKLAATLAEVQTSLGITK